MADQELQELAEAGELAGEDLLYLVQDPAGLPTSKKVPLSAVADFVGAGVSDHGDLTGLSDDDHPQYHNDARALTWIGSRSTSDLAEGSNLYYTNARADARIAAADHGVLQGLGDDDHAQYALLAGRSGGQILKGGTASGDHLTLQSTNHATRGNVQIQGGDKFYLHTNVLGTLGQTVANAPVRSIFEMRSVPPATDTDRNFAAQFLMFAGTETTVVSGTPQNDKVALYCAARRNADRPDHIWALNPLIDVHTGSNVHTALCAEFDINNHETDMPLLNTSLLDGVHINSGASKQPHTGLVIAKISTAASWRRGAWLSKNGISDVGLQVGDFLNTTRAAAIMVEQWGNGTDGFLIRRTTDSSPTGDLIRAVNTANDFTVFRVTADGRLVLGGTGLTNAALSMGSTVTPSGGNAFGMFMGGVTLQAIANGNGLFGMYSGGVVASGTFTGLNAFSLNVAAQSKTGTGTIANAVGIQIEKPTIGSNNYYLQFNVADNTDPTSGGGAAVGRIPISVGGTLRYIPYY
jgi:hypothetical protein